MITLTYFKVKETCVTTLSNIIKYKRKKILLLNKNTNEHLLKEFTLTFLTISCLFFFFTNRFQIDNMYFNAYLLEQITFTPLNAAYFNDKCKQNRYVLSKWKWSFVFTINFSASISSCIKMQIYPECFPSLRIMRFRLNSVTIWKYVITANLFTIVFCQSSKLVLVMARNISAKERKKTALNLFKWCNRNT